MLDRKTPKLLVSWIGISFWMCGLLHTSSCAQAAESKNNAALVAEVMAAERAFAKSMADRNLAAFAEWIDEEAIFYTRIHPTRGKAAIVAEWTPLFIAKQAPFSWEPDDVVVLDSGQLAMSAGPVRDPAGKIIARFNSIWRRDANQRWKVIFDKGNDVCRDSKTAG